MSKHFNDLEQNAWGGFLGTYAKLNRLIEEDLQAHSRLTHVEFEVLLRLSWNESHRMRIQDLAAESILTRSGVSRVVERLEKAGLVTREEAPEDRRGAYAVLTEAGAERFRVASQKHAECVRENFTNKFSEDELEVMGEFWKRLENTV
ncbi:MAG TPA: MarR family transcriptional regulator [Anaerolineales bacterium]|nr:MarR family transcriptional regulator [Anaerolineales bacterium]HUM26447.1 MarR family transcriptional regulator [Anaerolineales bacterium]